MSCYTCFFIRRDKDFVPIGSFSRNNTVARAFNDYHFKVPWEKISALTANDIQEVIAGVMENKQFDLNSIDKYEKKIAEIKAMEASLSERMEMIDEYKGYIDEAREDYEEWDYAHSFLSFLLGILDEVRYRDYDEDKEYDVDNYIYFGLEIDRPTIEDIV